MNHVRFLPPDPTTPVSMIGARIGPHVDLSFGVRRITDQLLALPPTRDLAAEDRNRRRKAAVNLGLRALACILVMTGTYAFLMWAGCSP